MARCRQALLLALLIASAAAIAAAEDAKPAGGKPAAGGAAQQQQPVGAGADPATPKATGAKAEPKAAAAQEQPAAADDGTAPKEVITEEEVQKAVEDAVAAQLQNKIQRVKAKLVETARAAELYMGTGDVSPTGACKDFIAKYCRKVHAGQGRLAACLTNQARAAEEDASTTDPLSAACQAELDAFKQDASTNINKNVQLALRCRKDVKQFCSDTHPEEEGAVLLCLRAHRGKLRPVCQKEVFKLEQDASDDIRTDPRLLRACKQEIARMCSDQDKHGGKVQDCLWRQQGSLDWQCKAELFRAAAEQSDDFRLNVAFMRACMDDKAQFCEGVAPGEANVKDCLELHMYEDGFSDDCRDRLSELISLRSRYFRLDSIIRTHCVDDITRLCGVAASMVETPEFMEKAPNTVGGDEGISRCLQDHRNEIFNLRCRNRVHAMIAATLRDVQFNHPLAEACAADRARLCNHVPLGSAAVVHCLQEHQAQLSDACQAKLFDTELAMAESIDFQWPMKEACSEEIEEYCGGVPHGRGRVIRCLERAADKHEDDFSKSCLKEVKGYQERASSDYRLNYRLHEACGKEAKRLCPSECGNLQRKTWCGGSVLLCLSNRFGDIADEGCQEEVEYYRKMRARSFKSDLALAEACHGDVESFCKDKPEGEIIPCLVQHRKELSPGCRREAVRVDITRGESIELMPNVNSACAEERKAHCGKVATGKGRVINCLLAKAGEQLDFSPVCLNVLSWLARRRMEDWRTDYPLRRACTADVDRYCAEQKKNADELLNGAVFRCLVNNVGSLSNGCAAEVARGAYTGLTFWSFGLPAVDACDGDVQTHCTLVQSASADGSAIHVETPNLNSVRDCLWSEVEQDREALAEQAGASVPGFPGSGVAAAAAAGSEGAGQRRMLAAAAAQEPGVDAAAELQGVSAQAAAAFLHSTAAAAAAQRRRLQQGEGQAAGQGADEAAVAVHLPRRTEPVLSPACRAFLDVALPADRFDEFQGAMTATAVVTQLAAIESSMGLKEGTLYNPAATSGKEVLTLTGWAALAGVFALVTVVLSGVVYGVRRWMGLGGNASRRGYTLVVKQELAHQGGRSLEEGGGGQAVGAGLPRRHA